MSDNPYAIYNANYSEGDEAIRQGEISISIQAKKSSLYLMSEMKRFSFEKSKTATGVTDKLQKN